MNQPRDNILLIGYRGTGKTSVGRELASQTGKAFVDADEQIENRAGKTIAEIFATGGESTFRDLEEQIVAELVTRDDHVISLGGGAVLREANRCSLQGAGKTIWLTALPETIAARLSKDATTEQRRPKLTPQGGLNEIQKMLEAREALYRQCADQTIATDGRSQGEIVLEIQQQLGFAG